MHQRGQAKSLNGSHARRSLKGCAPSRAEPTARPSLTRWQVAVITAGALFAIVGGPSALAKGETSPTNNSHGGPNATTTTAPATTTTPSTLLPPDTNPIGTVQEVVGRCGENLFLDLCFHS